MQAHKADKLQTFVVVMSGPESRNAIQQMTSQQKITIPVTFLPRGPREDDIAAYKINPAAKNTVLLWRRGTVRQGLVNVEQGSLPDLDKAVDDLLK